MIKHNALTIGGISTASFSCKVIVETSPSIEIGSSKTILYEHGGISGAVAQSNNRRNVVDYSYRIYLVKPNEADLNRFTGLLAKEGCWLESTSFPSVRLWCYKAETNRFERDNRGVYQVDVRFICHPTRYFKSLDTQTLTGNGSIRYQGTALAYPKIIIAGQSTSETQLTIGSQVIRLANLTGRFVMDNNPQHPSFKTSTGRAIRWSGDFITLDPSKGTSTGVVLGAGINSVTFETNWGWV
ncbi:TPA: phage tail protein [Streptococcus suis]|nr:phage tail protein [Streptococcus suis]HEM3633244.1 phage tail protein [Streptococcus suis]